MSRPVQRLQLRVVQGPPSPTHPVCWGVPAEHEEVEVVMLLPDVGSVEVFRAGEGILENPAVHDSASSAAGEGAQPIRGYAINGDADTVFDLPLSGVRAAA